MKLYRLRVLAGQCEVLSSQRALGFITEMKIGKLGKLAIEAINYHADKGLNPIIERKREIAITMREQNPDVSDDEIMSDPKFLEETNKEIEFWNSDTEEFKFDPIQMTLKDNFEFKDETKESNQFGFKYMIDPYVSLQNLIEEGFITVE